MHELFSEVLRLITITQLRHSHELRVPSPVKCRGFFCAGKIENKKGTVLAIDTENTTAYRNGFL